MSKSILTHKFPRVFPVLEENRKQDAIISSGDGTLSRRAWLMLVGSSALLSACGGGGDAVPVIAPPKEIGLSVKDAASADVQSGLAGVAYGHVTATQQDLGIAGVRKLGSSDALTSNDLMMLGSCTKAMTAYLAARLIERGLLTWDTTIAKVLPASQASMQPAYRTVTIEQMMAMISGIPSFINGTSQDTYPVFLNYLQNFTGSLPTTLQGQRQFFANWITSQPPQAGITPGRDYFYSNANYILVAAMLEAITGLSFEALFEQEVNQALGIRGGWTRPELVSASEPFGHQGPQGKLQVFPLDSPDILAWEPILNSAGLCVITPGDYAIWLRWHLLALSGKATPLPAGYLQRIKNLAIGSYAVGWVGANNNGRTSLLHDGAWEGFMSEAYVDQAGTSAGFGLTNTFYFAPDGSSWVINSLNQSLIQISLHYQ